MNKNHEEINQNDKNPLDYNKRADGFGAAGAESENAELPYEKEREEKKKEEPKAPTLDEHGMANQHGEVDQYSFRE
jgi:hypothetical protein